jgi:hypothetical protein
MYPEHKVQAAAEQAQASWRNTLQVHPACELIPPMSADELRELGQDVLVNGLTVPIAIIARNVPRKDGSFHVGDPRQPILVDGRSRLDAIELETGHPVQVIWRPIFPRSRVHTWFIVAGDWNTSGMVVEIDENIDPISYVISVNLHRRHLHLTAEGKRDLIAKLIKATPDKSDRQIAETVKASPTTVGTVRAGMEVRGEVSKLDTRTDARGVKQPARKSKPVTQQQSAAIKAQAALGQEPPPVSDAVLEQREAAAERIRGLMGGEARDDTPESAGEIARDEQIEDLETQLTHFKFQNVELRAEVRELKAALEDSDGRLLRAVSNEELYAELARRLPTQKSALKAIRHALDSVEAPVLNLKAASVTDSEPTKH